MLKTRHLGESFIQLDLITVELGIFPSLKRISKRSAQSGNPDLFDQASVVLEHSKQGTAVFVKEYQLLKRREPIGRNYRSLQAAAYFARILVWNGRHLPESKVLFELAVQTFEALSQGKAPEVVLLKSIFLLLKNEGYPVRESWWTQLPGDWQEWTRELLKRPSPRQIDPKMRSDYEWIRQHLSHWMCRNSDLTLPE